MTEADAGAEEKHRRFISNGTTREHMTDAQKRQLETALRAIASDLRGKMTSLVRTLDEDVGLLDAAD
ncbi:hypothetical protein [Phenylobacterium sp.]|uniref:hypothetical protein n=1 Tax=Phenylobacterium sp. TaxID=1871053 RepID=UPI002B5F87A6|nr:hypothetical protein [Phenylobacterium sp.]